MLEQNSNLLEQPDARIFDFKLFSEAKQLFELLQIVEPGEHTVYKVYESVRKLESNENIRRTVGGRGPSFHNTET